MGKFFMGLVLGLLGLGLWIIGSVLAAVVTVVEDDESIFASPVAGSVMVIGFTVMFGGPILYWFVLPVIGWWRRQRGG